jgi:hypothetical protein
LRKRFAANYGGPIPAEREISTTVASVYSEAKQIRSNRLIMARDAVQATSKGRRNYPLLCHHGRAYPNPIPIANPDRYTRRGMALLNQDVALLPNDTASRFVGAPYPLRAGSTPFGG